MRASTTPTTSPPARARTAEWFWTTSVGTYRQVLEDVHTAEHPSERFAPGDRGPPHPGIPPPVPYEGAVRELLDETRRAEGSESQMELVVDAGGLKPNTWQRFERLSSAWNQAKLGVADAPKGTTDNEPGVVANPRRRARTPLTAKQVDSIRTARENGESVLSIARRFDVHRATVWEYTRKPVATSSADSG